MEKVESENINTTRCATPEIDGSMRKRCREMTSTSSSLWNISPEYAAQRAERERDGTRILALECVCVRGCAFDVYSPCGSGCVSHIISSVCECFVLLHSATQHNFVLVCCRVSYFAIIIYTNEYKLLAHTQHSLHSTRLYLIITS